ncbi:MAG: hypothetical protein ACREE0_08900 [Phenylobacterium sp.]
MVVQGVPLDAPRGARLAAVGRMARQIGFSAARERAARIEVETDRPRPTSSGSKAILAALALLDAQRRQPDQIAVPEAAQGFTNVVAAINGLGSRPHERRSWRDRDWPLRRDDVCGGPGGSFRRRLGGLVGLGLRVRDLGKLDVDDGHILKDWS